MPPRRLRAAMADARWTRWEVFKQVVKKANEENPGNPISLPRSETQSKRLAARIAADSGLSHKFTKNARLSSGDPVVAEYRQAVQDSLPALRGWPTWYETARAQAKALEPARGKLKDNMRCFIEPCLEAARVYSGVDPDELQRIVNDAPWPDAQQGTSQEALRDAQEAPDLLQNAQRLVQEGWSARRSDMDAALGAETASDDFQKFDQARDNLLATWQWQERECDYAPWSQWESAVAARSWHLDADAHTCGLREAEARKPVVKMDSVAAMRKRKWLDRSVVGRIWDVLTPTHNKVVTESAENLIWKEAQLVSGSLGLSKDKGHNRAGVALGIYVAGILAQEDIATPVTSWVKKPLQLWATRKAKMQMSPTRRRKIPARDEWGSVENLQDEAIQNELSRNAARILVHEVWRQFHQNELLGMGFSVVHAKKTLQNAIERAGRDWKEKHGHLLTTTASDGPTFGPPNPGRPRVPIADVQPVFIYLSHNAELIADRLRELWLKDFPAGFDRDRLMPTPATAEDQPGDPQPPDVHQLINDMYSEPEAAWADRQWTSGERELIWEALVTQARLHDRDLPDVTFEDFCGWLNTMRRR